MLESHHLRPLVGGSLGVFAFHGAPSRREFIVWIPARDDFFQSTGTHHFLPPQLSIMRKERREPIRSDLSNKNFLAKEFPTVGEVSNKSTWNHWGVFYNWTPTVNKVYTLRGNMESKINFLKKPAAGAARIWILYRSPLENVQHFRKRGSVRNYCD